MVKKLVTKKSILDGLNKDQQLPVKNYKGPQFIIAGPGAGKTKTVVARTQYMILDGVKPSNILLFTFTNKAAKEIKERIAKAVGPKASDITIGTYHSFCCRLLRKYADKLGYNNSFTIFDSEDSAKIIKKIIDNDDIDDKMLASYISKQKHKVISPQEAMTNASANKDPYAKYYNDYQNGF